MNVPGGDSNMVTLEYRFVRRKRSFLGFERCLTESGSGGMYVPTLMKPPHGSSNLRPLLRRWRIQYDFRLKARRKRRLLLARIKKADPEALYEIRQKASRRKFESDDHEYEYEYGFRENSERERSRKRQRERMNVIVIGNFRTGVMLCRT